MSVTTSPTMPRRDIAPDALRGLAILGVVLIHGGWIYSSSTPSTDPAPLLLVMDWFRWGVPVFLMLSFYFAYLSWRKAPQTGYGEFAKKRLPRLLVPFLFWSVFYFLFGNFYFLPHPITGVSKIVTTYFMGRGWSGQYFFIILIQLTLLLPLSFRRTVTRSLLIASVVATLLLYAADLALICGFGPHKLQGPLIKLRDIAFFFWLPYVLFPIYLIQTNQAPTATKEEAPGAPSFPTTSLLILVLAPVLLSIEELVRAHFHAHEMSPYLYLTTLPVALLVFYHGWRVFSALPPSGFTSFLAYLGRNSLGIFCLNPLFVLLLLKIAPPNEIGRILPQPLLLVSPILLVIFITAAALSTIALLRRIRLGFLVE